MKINLKNNVLKTGNLLLLGLSVLVLANPVMANDCSFEVTQDPVSVDEGKRAKFEISIKCDVSKWSWKTFRYAYRTVDDTAESSDDYSGKTGNHTFNNPQRGTTYVKTTRVTTKADNVCESIETFDMDYDLQGKTKAGWTDWTSGAGGLPGSFKISANIADQTSGC